MKYEYYLQVDMFGLEHPMKRDTETGEIEEMGENWKVIQGYDKYMVSDQGRVARLSGIGKKPLNPCKASNGYYKVTLHNENGAKSAWVHRLVAEAFVNRKPGCELVNHKDENPENNVADNLEWCDHSYNSNYGKQFIRNMLRSKSVVQYTEDGEYVTSYPSATIAAQKFGVKLNRSHITDCANGKRPKACGFVWKYKGDGEVIDFSDYQKLAARTINLDNSRDEMIQHALLGLTSEVGELCGIFQKSFQGHSIDESHAMKEVSDILWFVAEYCSAMCISLQDVAETNIAKLRARYPEGFEEERSLNREEGDV